MIRILIGDDHRIVREGLKQMLADAPDGQRVMATSENPHWVELLQAEEWVGKSVQIAENQLVVT